MKRRILSLIVSLFLLGTVSAQQYTVNAHAYDNNMPVVAVIHIDNAVPTTGTYEIGAFINDEVRGSALIQSDLDNTYWMQVYYNTETESDATISFKVYDGTDVMDVTTTLAVNPEGAGTKADPQVLDVVTQMTQTTSMAAGWTWWSTPIEMNGVDGLAMLENSLGHNGVIIKSQNYGVQNYYQNTGYDYWYGQLTNYGITNEQSYLVNTSAACAVNMVGTYANPSDHPIALTQGWNWIGYPVNAQQTVSSALSGFTPSANDVIKGQTSGATYYANYGWYPSTFVLEPGKGYQYNSNASENTLTYSVSRKHDDAVVESLHHWSADVHHFQSNIFVMATVSVDGVELQGGDIELGAFVNGECRGSAKLDYFEPTGRWYAMMVVSGEDGDVVEFGVFNNANNETNMPSKDYIVYVKDAIVGSLDSPMEIHFGTNNELIVFPNPIECNQSFTLDIPIGETVTEMTIVNAVGEVLRHNVGVFDTSSVQGVSSSGIYTVTIMCKSGKVYHARLIVK